MERLATIAAPDLCRRVRCRVATGSDVACVAEPFRFLPPQGARAICDRAAQRGLALASWLYSTRHPKRMDFRLEESLPVSALCPFHLSPRRSHHSRILSNLL